MWEVFRVRAHLNICYRLPCTWYSRVYVRINPYLFTHPANYGVGFEAPMIFGTLADTLGRRPISCVCLIILSLSCVGLALVPTSAYWLLMVLRCVQAAGSASSIAIGMMSHIP